MIVTNFQKHLFSLSGAVVLCSSPMAQSKQINFHYDHILGTSLDIIVYCEDRLTAELAQKTVLSEIERLTRVFNSRLYNSELSVLNRSSEMILSQDLYSVIVEAERWRFLTDGAFDIRIGEIENVWKSSSLKGTQPSATSLKERANLLKNSQLIIDHIKKKIFRPKDISFALDGISKGYIIDASIEKVFKILPKVKGLLVDVGGDIRCRGQGPNLNGWNIGVFDPHSPEDNVVPEVILQVNNSAIATSGRGERDLKINGNFHSHTFSPDSGFSTDSVASVTVIAPNAMQADALSTAFSVMNPSEAITLAKSIPDLEFKISLTNGGSFTSINWGAHTIQTAPENLLSRVIGKLSNAFVSEAYAESRDTWPKGFKLSIKYEILKQTANRYRRPYVVIWITDPDGDIVKTLQVLGRRSGYQATNYVWSRKMNTPNLSARVESVTRPTRYPGKYSVSWDGTNDKNVLVKKGKYKLHIEASRQRGGHSYYSKNIEIGETTFEEFLQAGGELGNAYIKFEKK